MNRTLLILAGSLFFGGLFVVYLYREAFIANETGGVPIPVLVALIDIPIGVPVRDEWLMVRSIPEAYVEGRHIPAEMRREIVGLPLAQAVHENEALLRTDLLAALGRQAHAVVQRAARDAGDHAADHPHLDARGLASAGGSGRRDPLDR